MVRCITKVFPDSWILRLLSDVVSSGSEQERVGKGELHLARVSLAATPCIDFIFARNYLIKEPDKQ